MSNNMTLKFLLVGDARVGKTSIVHRLCRDSFGPMIEPTVGVDFSVYIVNIDQSVVKLQIWDTAGQERFRSLGRAYYRNSVGVFFVFSLADHSSFENIESWYKDVIPLCHPKVQVALVGNKADMIDERAVTQDEIHNLSSNLKIPYYESSAKTGNGVSEMFVKLTRKIYSLVVTNELVVDQELHVDSWDDEEDSEKAPTKKKGCC